MKNLTKNMSLLDLERKFEEESIDISSIKSEEELAK